MFHWRAKMKTKKFCSNCRALIPSDSKCSCRKSQPRQSNKKHVGRTYRFRKLRKNIIERDDGHCQRCMIKYGVFETEHLQVHHIKNQDDFPELAYDEDNLITVCRLCNTQMGKSDKLDFAWEPPTNLGDMYCL